jgi:Tfp pilus assembly protein FimT
LKIKTTNERMHRGAEGYSVIELLIIAAVVVILTGLAVFSLAPQKRAYRTDDAAAQITNFMRDAYHRALSQRQTMRVQIDRANMLVKIIDEGKLPGGDEGEVRRAKLSDDISVNQPTVASALLSPPAAPYNYSVAAYTNNLWEARIKSDGSVIDTAGNPLSATVFVSLVNMKTTETNLIRAITLFGASGSMRVWRYNGTSFDAGAN